MSYKVINYLFVCLVVALITSPLYASSYAGEQQREIKALSADDIDGYLTGAGMGLAKSAELNGYPGPLHVLELADDLALSAEQKSATQSLYDQVKQRAKTLGSDVIQQEQVLEQMFRDDTITPQALNAQVEKISALQGELRAAHLMAHIEQTRVLSAAQIEIYQQLRGYADADQHHKHKHSKHKH